MNFEDHELVRYCHINIKTIKKSLSFFGIPGENCPVYNKYQKESVLRTTNYLLKMSNDPAKDQSDLHPDDEDFQRSANQAIQEAVENGDSIDIDGSFEDFHSINQSREPSNIVLPQAISPQEEANDVYQEYRSWCDSCATSLTDQSNVQDIQNALENVPRS